MDYLLKYDHFMTLGYLYITAQVIKSFLYKIEASWHVPMDCLLSGSSLYQAIVRIIVTLQGSKLCCNMAYHPHLNGEMEVLRNIYSLFSQHFPRCDPSGLVGKNIGITLACIPPMAWLLLRLSMADYHHQSSTMNLVWHKRWMRIYFKVVTWCCVISKLTWRRLKNAWSVKPSVTYLTRN